MAFTKNNMSEEERNTLIQQALETSEGRLALAQSMANPIQTSLLYQSIGRKLVVPDPLPQGALARYERDIEVPAFKLSKRGAVPDEITEGFDFLVETFEIGTYPQVPLTQIRQRMFNIVDRVQVKAKNEISVIEDNEIFKTILAAVPAFGYDTALNHVINSVANGVMQINDVNLAMAKVEYHRLVANKLVMNSNRFADIRAWGKDVFDFVSQREVLLTGVYAKLFGMDIYITNQLPSNTVILASGAEFVGVMPIRQEITVIPADKPNRLRLGWVVYEEIGVSVPNGKGIAQITIS